MTPNSLYKISAATLITNVAMRILGYFTPSSLTWGIDYFSYLPFPFVAIYAIIGLITALWLIQATTQNKPTAIIPERFTTAPFILPLTGAIFIAAALAFQIQLPLLGDSFIVVQNYENTFKGVHTLHLGNEPVSHWFLSTIIRLMGATTYPAMLSGFLTSEIILGAAYIALAFLAATGLQPNPRNRNLVFVALLSLPVMQIFFGYVEIYAAPAVAVLAYAAAAIYNLNRRARIEIVAVGLLFALFSHYLALVLLPSLYYCLWRATVGESTRKIPAAYAIGLGLVVTAIALWVFVSHESSGSHLLSLTSSGADQYQAYTMFSLYHVSELLNLILLYSPFLVLLLAFTLRNGIKSLLENERHAFLAIAAAGYVAFLLVAKFDLGLAADWDVTGPYAGLIVLLAVSVFLKKEGAEADRLAHRRIVIAIIILGFAQTIPWYYLNASTEPNLARTKRFLDSRTVSPDGNYQGHFHLSYAYSTLNKPNEAADMWKSFSEMYPNDWRGFQNYAHQAVAAGRAEDPATEEAYKKAFALDTARRMQREFSTYYSDLAKIAFQNGKPDSTIYLLQHAIAIDSSNVGAWFNLASVYDAIDNVNAATSAYFELLDRAPRFIPGYEGILKNLLKLGSPQAAVEIGEKALAINTSSASVYQSLAEAYAKLNRPADAEFARRRAAELVGQK